MEKFYKTCMTCDARLTSDEKAISKSHCFRISLFGLSEQKTRM